MTTVSGNIQTRRDTAANWTSVNPVLLSGEFGYETDTGLIKIGDGATAWTSLNYVAAGETIYLAADSMRGYIGSPALTTLSTSRYVSGWSTATTGFTGVAGALRVPESWHSAAGWLWTRTSAAGSGVARFGVYFSGYFDGDEDTALGPQTTGNGGFDITVSTSANIIQRTAIMAAVDFTSLGKLFAVRVVRDGGHANDTYTQSLEVVGVELVRAS